MMLDPLTITVLLNVMGHMLMPHLLRRAPILVKITDGLPLRSKRARTIVLERTR